MEKISLELVPVVTAEARTLIDELDRTLATEYLPEQRHGLALEAIFQPHVRFFIARSDGVAVGCGGVALFTTFAEVKRMYVRNQARGRGIARAMLSRLEDETRTSGRDVLCLETGTRQVAALRLYERAGFRPCDPFGEYASMAPREIATSIFLEKQLDLAIRPGASDLEELTS